jgi:hypothetical protein
MIRRTADLRLSDDGTIRGKVQTEYLRQEALSMRLEAIHQDEAARKKALEESMKNMLTQEATVSLTSMEGWEDSDAPLRASFEVEIPNFAMRAGRRLVVPVGIFHSNQTNPFFSARRVHPIYFSHSQEIHEDVKLELPAENESRIPTCAPEGGSKGGLL